MDDVSEQSIPMPPPPRWKGAQSLGPVYQLNERCIELLCDAAASDSPQVTLSIVTEHRELWVGLDLQARQRLASLPFVIVDARFRNDAKWRRVTETQAHHTHDAPLRPGCLSFPSRLPAPRSLSDRTLTRP